MNNKNSAREAAIRYLAGQFENLDTTELEAYFLVFGVSEQIRLKVEASFAKFDLSRARFMPLAMLFTAPERRMKPSELAEHAGVTRATMTGILDVLEGSGMIHRVNDPEDRRALNIELTKQGEKLMRKVLPNHFQNVSKIMSGVTEAERRSLASIFRKIESNIEGLK